MTINSVLTLRNKRPKKETAKSRQRNFEKQMAAFVDQHGMATLYASDMTRGEKIGYLACLSMIEHSDIDVDSRFYIDDRIKELRKIITPELAAKYRYPEVK